MQFAQVPYNLAGDKTTAAYLDTGHWSKLAIHEAEKLTPVQVLASSSESGYDHVPAYEEWQWPQNPSYVHITPNETIHGVEFYDLPGVPRDTPIVADMSSTILSRPFDVSRYGLIYAGAQKNIGPAGLALVIIKKELLSRSAKSLPNMWSYAVQASKGSLYNTPPTFGIYLSGLVFKWLKAQGGLEVVAVKNKAKADKFYHFLDANDFYSNKVKPEFRSWMNIPFFLKDDTLNAEFIAQAEAAGLLGLKGHRVIGGMRASFYNAVEMTSVEALIEFMTDFAQKRG